MFSFPDPKTNDPKERRKQRMLEIIPGTLTWATIIGMFALSFFVPVWVAIFVIIFDIYWIHRTIFIAYYSIEGYRKLAQGKKIDWWERCQNISNPENYQKLIEEKIKRMAESLKFGNGMKFREKGILRKEIERQKEYLFEVGKLSKIKNQILDWREVIHIVLLPTANEPAEIIEPAIQAIKDSNFPNEQFIVLLATEEREPVAHRLEKVNYLKNKFKGVFRDFLVTTHEVSEGEMKCKASNATYAAKKLAKYLEEKNIDFI